MPAAAGAARVTWTRPLGDVANSQSRNGFGNVGLAWTGAKGYFGGSYGYDDTKYGIPVVEDGQVQLTPRRHAFSLRGGGAEPRRRLRLVPRHAGRAALQARRAGRRRGRHLLHQRLERARSSRLAPRDRAAEGQPRRVVSRSRLRCARRGGAVAGGRSARRGRVRLRGADLAARDAAVRRPRRTLALRAGRRGRAQLHHRIRIAGAAVPSGRRRRSR